MQSFGNVVQNANVYVEGKGMLGKAKTVKLPDYEKRREETRPLGLPAPVMRPTGLEPMECEMVFESYEKDVLTQVGGNKVREKQYMVRFSTEDSNGVVKYGVAQLSGNAYKLEPSPFENNDEAATLTLTVDVISYKLDFDGPVYDIDVEVGKLNVGGVNHWDAAFAGL